MRNSPAVLPGCCAKASFGRIRAFGSNGGYRDIMKKSYAALLLLLCFLLPLPGRAEGLPHNPLIDPRPVDYKLNPADEILNILLLGIDKSDRAVKYGSDYHTDAIMVVAVNRTKNRVDLVSLPRDTLSYVPGIKGIYKLNAAINCGGGKTEEGFNKVMEAASWLLGGIRVDHYAAVDMQGMKLLGDAIGGVDFELETRIPGYGRGWRHLDGEGIVQYLRTRRGAQVNANDIGRTGRQRDLMQAIFEKVMSDRRYPLQLMKAIAGAEGGFFTNLNATEIMSLFGMAMSVDRDDIGSHVLTGRYRSALRGWNFTFTDQAHRLEVIREVYGVEAEEIPYVSLEYTKWLTDGGFHAARYLAVADVLLSAAEGMQPNEKQQEAIAALLEAKEAARTAFLIAADSMSKEDTQAMKETRRALRKAGEVFEKAFPRIKSPGWGEGKYWYLDRLINEVDVNFR